MPNNIVWGDVRVLDIVIAAVVLVFTIVIAKAISLYLKRLLKEQLVKDHLQLIGKIVSFSIYIIGLFSVFAILGVNLKGIVLAGSVAGVIIGFASQNIIGNFISGIFLILERPMKIGDQVQIDEVTGFVEDIRIISTIIRTYEGIYVRIPNQTVFTTKMINFVGHKVRRFEYTVGIRYSDDAEKAISLIQEKVREQPFALLKPSPQIFVDNLGDNSVNITARIWAPVSEWHDLRMSLLWKIKKFLEENGIEIAFPQRTLWFANELRTDPEIKSD